MQSCPVYYGTVNAPLVVVSTRADEYPPPCDSDIAAALKQLGEDGASHFHVSSKDGSGFSHLLDHLVSLAKSLPHMGQLIPRSVLHLEQDLKLLPEAESCTVPLERVLSLEVYMV